MNIPIYNAVINDETDGIYAISLVEYPATEVDWMCFNSNEKKSEQQVFVCSADSKQHILAGVVMVADTPIYRIGPDGEEYYIVFTKETIRMMAEKMLRDHSFNNINIQHDGILLDNGSVSLMELFIKDSSRGVNPNYINNVPDGTLLANYHVNDEKLWNDIITNKVSLKGFSLEGMFNTERIAEINFKKQNMKIKEKLKKLLVTLNEVVTDKGILSYEEEDLAIGVEVLLDNNTDVPDGNYTLEDKTIIEVKDGKVVDIKNFTEDIVDENVIKEDNIKNDDSEEINKKFDERISQIENRVSEISDTLSKFDQIINELKDSVTELQHEPVVSPINESSINMSSDNSFKNRAIEIADWINSLK